MDEADIGNETAELFLAQALKAARRSRNILATGLCLNCDEALDEPRQRWCDHECASDWQAREDAKRRNGSDA